MDHDNGRDHDNGNDNSKDHDNGSDNGKDHDNGNDTAITIPKTVIMARALTKTMSTAVIDNDSKIDNVNDDQEMKLSSD